MIPNIVLLIIASFLTYDSLAYFGIMNLPFLGLVINNMIIRMLQGLAAKWGIFFGIFGIVFSIIMIIFQKKEKDTTNVAVVTKVLIVVLTIMCVIIII